MSAYFLLPALLGINVKLSWQGGSSATRQAAEKCNTLNHDSEINHKTFSLVKTLNVDPLFSPKVIVHVIIQYSPFSLFPDQNKEGHRLPS